MLNGFLREEKNREYRITAPVSFGTFVLLPAVEFINANISGADFALSLTDVVLNLFEDDIDVAIRNVLPPNDVEYEPLMRVGLVAIASKEYLEKAPPLDSLADIVNHRLVDAKLRQHEWERT